VTKRSLW